MPEVLCSINVADANRKEMFSHVCSSAVYRGFACGAYGRLFVERLRDSSNRGDSEGSLRAGSRVVSPASVRSLHFRRMRHRQLQQSRLLEVTLRHPAFLSHPRDFTCPGVSFFVSIIDSIAYICENIFVCKAFSVNGISILCPNYEKY